MLISLLEVCQEGGSRSGVLGEQCGILIRDMEEKVNPDVMNNVFFTQRKIP